MRAGNRYVRAETAVGPNFLIQPNPSAITPQIFVNTAFYHL